MIIAAILTMIRPTRRKNQIYNKQSLFWHYNLAQRCVYSDKLTSETKQHK